MKLSFSFVLEEGIFRAGRRLNNLELSGVSESSKLSKEHSRVLRLFRIIIKAELMGIRVSHVEKADLPSKLWKCAKAFIRES